jgi:hypothetical protein
LAIEEPGWIEIHMPHEAYQDAEKVRQRRSRIAQGLNVPKPYASPLRSLRPCWTAFLSILSFGGISALCEISAMLYV